MFSEDYVPNPVDAYILQGRCLRSMTGHLSYDSYVSVYNEACTLSVAIMTCYFVLMKRSVNKNIKETTKYDHIFCLVYLY